MPGLDAAARLGAKAAAGHVCVYTMRRMQRRAFVLVNRVVNVVVRRLRLRRFRGADLLFLTTTGRKTGQSRTTPLLYLAEATAGSWWPPTVAPTGSPAGG
jgi:F420H(2)-dependent quinone reductase